MDPFAPNFYSLMQDTFVEKYLAGSLYVNKAFTRFKIRFYLFSHNTIKNIHIFCETLSLVASKGGR